MVIEMDLGTENHIIEIIDENLEDLIENPGNGAEYVETIHIGLHNVGEMINKEGLIEEDHS